MSPSLRSPTHCEGYESIFASRNNIMRGQIEREKNKNRTLWLKLYSYLYKYEPIRILVKCFVTLRADFPLFSSFSFSSFLPSVAWSTAVTNEFHIINCQKGNMSKAGRRRRIADIYKGLLHLSLSLSYFRGLACSHLIWEALSLIAPANGTNRREGREERWKDKMSERCADRGKEMRIMSGALCHVCTRFFLLSFYS